MLVGRYAKGMIPSPKDEVGLGHPRHLTAAPIVEQASIITPVVDQLQLGACTGNSFAVGLQVEMSRALKLPVGQYVELPARRWLYGLGRAKLNTYKEDSGAMISDVAAGAQSLGFPPESAMPYPLPSDSPDVQLAKCIEDPDTMVAHRAADQKLLKGVYRLLTTGQELADDIARAIALGNVVVWGTDLDMAFEELGPHDVWPGVTGEIIGGHAMLFRAFKPDTKRPGKRLYGSLSSWDYSFADGGTAWVTQDAATNPIHASEWWVISLVDNYSELVALKPPRLVYV